MYVYTHAHTYVCIYVHIYIYICIRTYKLTNAGWDRDAFGIRTQIIPLQLHFQMCVSIKRKSHQTIDKQQNNMHMCGNT